MDSSITRGLSCAAPVVLASAIVVLAPQAGATVATHHAPESLLQRIETAQRNLAAIEHADALPNEPIVAQFPNFPNFFRNIGPSYPAPYPPFPNYFRNF